NPIKTRPATRPARGMCRWLARPNAHHQSAVLAINGTAYEVLPAYDGEALAGYRLLNADAAMYDLPAHPSGCDCPGHTFHPERQGVRVATRGVREWGRHRSWFCVCCEGSGCSPRVFPPDRRRRVLTLQGLAGASVA